MSTTDSEALFDVPLILGMMRLGDYDDLARAPALADWIRARLDQGLDLFDHADIYDDNACEKRFGEALAAAPELKQKVRLITKTDIVPSQFDTSDWRVKHYNTEGRYISAAIDASLKRLQVDHIDCFLVHRPDPLMDAADTARALEDAVQAGKVGQVGVSNFLPDQWRLLQGALGQKLVCNQIELSLREASCLFDGTAEALLNDGLQLLAWSPLAGGSLQDGDLLGAALKRAGEAAKLSPTALAISWLRRLPGSPVPVVGSLNPERITEALAGTEYRMAREMWFFLLEAARGHRVA